MKLAFTGVGGAFASPEQYQTNAVMIADDGCLLIDCGSDARHALAEQGIKLPDIKAVYISHLHADHVGGMEWLAFCTYFNPNLERPQLFADAALMGTMWFNSLRGGLDSIEGKVMDLTDYFDCVPVYPNGSFTWRGATFETIQTVHVMAGRKIVHSYGLMITTPTGLKIFYTSDTQFCPSQIYSFYRDANWIFQDCETTPFKSNVHSHLDDLLTLEDQIRGKMRLMHYAPMKDMDYRAMDDYAKRKGFAGFVEKGQVFDLETL
jgi:ribonuclease BN (tRNA processing enzyme)